MNQKKDLLQLMLSVDEIDLPEGVSKSTWIQDQIKLFTFAGTGTSSSLMGWSTSLLASKPELQQRIQKELDDICGPGDEPPTYFQLQKLKYLDAFVKEVLRLYTPAPLIIRSFNEDLCEIDGISLPPGTSFKMDFLKMHRRTDFFSRPDELLPERWMNDGSDPNAPTANADAFVPFAFGFRSCIGKHFAMIEVKTILATLLRAHRISFADDTQTVPEGAFTLILFPLTRFTVRLIPRNSS